MPVTITIITADSGSRRSESGAVKSPELIQSNTVWTIARASGSGPTRRDAAASETANEPAIAAQATAPETALLNRRPKLALTRKPTNGNSGISSSIGGTTPTIRLQEDELPFQLGEH